MWKKRKHWLCPHPPKRAVFGLDWAADWNSAHFPWESEEPSPKPCVWVQWRWTLWESISSHCFLPFPPLRLWCCNKRHTFSFFTTVTVSFWEKVGRAFTWCRVSAILSPNGNSSVVLPSILQWWWDAGPQAWGLSCKQTQHWAGTFTPLRSSGPEFLDSNRRTSVSCSVRTT